jgi:hypothetical protein
MLANYFVLRITDAIGTQVLIKKFIRPHEDGELSINQSAPKNFHISFVAYFVHVNALSFSPTKEQSIYEHPPFHFLDCQSFAANNTCSLFTLTRTSTTCSIPSSDNSNASPFVFLSFSFHQDSSLFVN